MLTIKLSFIERKVFTRICSKGVLISSFLMGALVTSLCAFELKDCIELGRKGDRFHLRCDIVCDDQEQGLYKEGFECSLIHPHCSEVRYKIDSTPMLRYITTFKKQRFVYSKRVTLRASCKIAPEFDDKIPLVVAVSSLVLHENGNNNAQVKIAQCARRLNPSVNQKNKNNEQAVLSKDLTKKDKEFNNKRSFLFSQKRIHRFWQLYRILYRCWLFFLLVLLCMHIGGYKIERSTFFYMIIVSIIALYPFVPWEKQSYLVFIGALFFLGFATGYCMLSYVMNGYAPWWKRTFARICALSIIPLFVYWYVCTTIESPPSDGVNQQHQEGG